MIDLKNIWNNIEFVKRNVSDVEIDETWREDSSRQ